MKSADFFKLSIIRGVFLLGLIAISTTLYAWVPNSVLASGDWVKMSISQTGVYRLNYDYLKTNGVISGDIASDRISIWGYPGGLLPQDALSQRVDDLQEIAIQVVDGGDGNFQQGDYVLFYGEAPLRWRYQESDGRYHYEKSPYTTRSSYFITSSRFATKRIADQVSLPGTPTYSSSVTDALRVVDEDVINLIKSGRVWYGEQFPASGQLSYNFSFSGPLTADSVYIRTEVAARDFTGASYALSINGNSVLSNRSIAAVEDIYYKRYVNFGTDALLYVQSGVNSLNFQYNYQKVSSVSLAWFSFLEVNARIQATYNGKSDLYLDKRSKGNAVAAFSIAGLGGTDLWEVTDPANVKKQLHNNGNFQYDATTSIRSFMAVADFKVPEAAVKVKNQNLHALSNADMLLITVPALKFQADRLAELHRQKDNMTVHVIMVEDIYNEFSSGEQSVPAIRDFVRMFYERHGTQAPRYLLLFGDASYDYLGKLPTNTNMVPTFQCSNSFDPGYSYATDDYFGMLDPWEGSDNTVDKDSIDIGIGRIPAKNLEEAKAVVDKIIRYASPASFGDWRNRIVLVADDKDEPALGSHSHMGDAETCYQIIANNHKQYNIDKIYCDAIPQKSTPQGARYPDVNKAISEAFNKGALVVNYSGHGGETGLGHEEFLTMTDINGWRNPNNLPMVFTATCEFSRFDDPMRNSAGETILLNKENGGIALMTTTRLVYAFANLQLNTAFYNNNVLAPVNGKMPTLGDAFRKAKNAVVAATGANTRNFSLLGDPALRLAYPELTVVTTKINGQAAGQQTIDTLKALTLVEIEGEIRDQNGNLAADFNGIVIPSLLDKPVNMNTLQNDPWSTITTFELQKNYIFKGRVSVSGGKFRYQFIVPKDISYADGLGKISYYAYSDQKDAGGFDDNIAITGNNQVTIEDKTGPEIYLWMETRDFKPNDYVGANTLLIADLKDASGINTTGTGVGREITCLVPGEPDATYVMNDYYLADLNDFRKGSLEYPINGLQPGIHTLMVKAWDVFNNSSMALVTFRVAKDNEILIFDLKNYPNPFFDQTQFAVTHNKSGADIKITIDVINAQGQLVFTKVEEVSSAGGTVQGIYWDGNNLSGTPVQPGVYLYRFRIEDANGNFAEKTSRLVFGN